MRRNDLACDESRLAGQLVNEGKPLVHTLRPIDEHGDDRDTPAQLPKTVAVRPVGAVVAPEPAEARRPSGARAAQSTYQLVVERVPGPGPCLLTGIDHDLLPDVQPAVVGGGETVRLGEPATVTLADANLLECQQRPGQQATQVGEQLSDRPP